MTATIQNLAAAASLAVLLVGCNATGLADGRFRNAEVPLSVTTRSAPEMWEGDWLIRAAFPNDGDIKAVAFVGNWRGRPAFELVRGACDANGDCEDTGEIWRAERLGLNRWRLRSPHDTETRELWVIWVDEGYRTAAIGEPDGGYAWILDRAATGGGDRISAAREILDFNGYDTTALVPR